MHIGECTIHHPSYILVAPEAGCNGCTEIVPEVFCEQMSNSVNVVLVFKYSCEFTNGAFIFFNLAHNTRFCINLIRINILRKVRLTGSFLLMGFVPKKVGFWKEDIFRAFVSNLMQ